MLFAAADLTNQEDGIEDHARDDCGQQDDSKDEPDAGAPVEHKPAEVKEERKKNQADAERDKRDRFSSVDSNHYLKIAPRGGAITRLRVLRLRGYGAWQPSDL